MLGQVPEIDTSRASLADVRRTGFVYALIDPRPEKYGRVRYVGKTEKERISQRLNEHTQDAKRRSNTNPVYRWFRKLSDLGLRPKAMVIESCPVEILYQREQHHISVMRAIYPDLLNLCDRGPGSACRRASPKEAARLRSYNVGRVFSPETREKMRIAHLGKPGPTGRKFSPEHIEKIRLTSTGRRHTAETCAKIGNAHRGRIVSQATREKIRAAQLGRKHTPQSIENMRQGHLNYWAARRGV